MGGGGQDGCERRSEAFVKIKKKGFYLGGGGVGSDRGGGGGGFRVDVNGEVKFFVKIQKKKKNGGGGGGWAGGPIRGWSGGGGSKVWGRWVMLGKEDVNQE